MQAVQLKLKQASAVLGAPPKDVQNLVQFGLVRPRRRKGVYWFDASALLTANVVFYLKDSLGASTASLSRVIREAAKLPGFTNGTASVVSIQLRRRMSRLPLEIRIPLRALAEDLERRLLLANAVPDLPRGRKRPGWKAEFRAALKEAAADLGTLSDADVLAAIRRSRARQPELTVVVDPEVVST
jgi:hypothetical protein